MAPRAIARLGVNATAIRKGELSESPGSARPYDRATVPMPVTGACAPGAIAWDMSFRVTSWSAGAQALLGYSASDVIGKSGVDILGQAGSTGTIAQLRHVIETRRCGIRVVSRVRSKDGRSIVCEWYHAPVFDASGAHVGFASSVSRAGGIERRAEPVVLRDGLTGLPSLALFMDRLEHALAAAPADADLALFAIEIDRLGDVDDSNGRDFSRALMREAGARIAAALRAGDSLARRDGARFLALLPESGGRAGAMAIAQRILDCFDDPFRIGSRRVDRAASVGIAQFPGDGGDGHALLRCADRALEGAKQLGGCTVACAGATTPDEPERVSLERDLRLAVERQEFELQYQPQFDLRSGALCGVEALLRWRHPQRGLLTPSDFVAVAEETGLIVPIGTWALRAACEAMRGWQDSGVGVPRITINVSGKQFRRRFIDEVAQALCDTDVDPAVLELEFTESVTMQSTQTCLRLLDELKSFGVRLAIDDFGVGYSSLAFLARLPVDSLKIDRFFVGDCSTNPANAAIVRAIVTMAAGLDLEVTCEGVETEEQADFVRALGCEAAQGFLFSAPIPLAAVPAFVAGLAG